MNETIDTNQAERKAKTPEQRAEQVARINRKLKQAKVKLKRGVASIGDDVSHNIDGKTITVSSFGSRTETEGRSSVHSIRDYREVGRDVTQEFSSVVVKNLEGNENDLLSTTTTASKKLLGDEGVLLTVHRQQEGDFESSKNLRLEEVGGVVMNDVQAEHVEAATLNAIRSDISKIRGAQKVDAGAKIQYVFK